MKKLLTIFILILSVKGFSQSYFSGKFNYCTPKKEESKKKFDAVIKALQFPNLYEKASYTMVKVASQDSTYCDAYFMAGYLFRLQDKYEEAIAYYYVADSLAKNKSLEFKQNLATEMMRAERADLAREKYQEMVKYFPNSPEGYYGVANTAIVLNDFDNGLNNLKKAEKLYESSGEVKDDVKYMYGMLNCLKENYEEALPYFDEVYSTYKKDIGYLSLYALTLIKVGKSRNDGKIIKKAWKTYEKIKDVQVPEDLAKKIKQEFSSNEILTFKENTSQSQASVQICENLWLK
ncbi:tetratricopeptide repeat protein [Chryseobacterium sp. StRB126]|uniref:tetratricopeptide repeat protein n=1 Tax=Chryseobacterium sp. StRB126 TaxID=878220 RepID=UPI0004E99F57|nr:hypothetical protein [Chryseobacterium sp. StRB126]BAP31772.1 tetratricopeptide repeat protein [Chryseobacterium sp. StRB126]